LIIDRRALLFWGLLIRAGVIGTTKGKLNRFFS